MPNLLSDEDSALRGISKPVQKDVQDETYGHDDAADADVWTQTFANTGRSPEDRCEALPKIS